jgi:hypothetical protein
MLAILLAAAFAAGDGQEAETGGKAKDERRICRRVHDSSSRIGHIRVCRTVGQWKQEDAENEQISGRIHSRAADITQGPGGVIRPTIPK